MSGFADDDEAFADHDPEIDYDKLEEVAEVFETLSPLAALTAVYGDSLIVPA